MRSFRQLALVLGDNMLGAESPWLDAALVVVVRPFLTDETGPRELVQPLDPDVSERNRTLYGHKAVVECLMEAGANKDNGDRDGRTPMQLAAMNGNEGVVHCLLRAGADKNKADHEGRTPMHTAASMGKRRVVCICCALLAGSCADKNKPNTDGRTPMHLAAGNGLHDVALCLPEAGADKDRAAIDGDTPMHYADEWSFQEFCAACCKLVLTRTVGMTPMHLAAKNGQLEVMLVLTRPSTTNLPSRVAITKLRLAC